MAELEIRLSDVEKRQDTFEATVRAYMESQKQRDEDFRTEMRDFKTEMRDRDNQRAAEIRELRQSQDAQIREIDRKFERMDQKIDGIGKFVQNLTIAAMVGIGAVVVGNIAIAVAVITAVTTK